MMRKWKCWMTQPNDNNSMINTKDDIQSIATIHWVSNTNNKSNQLEHEPWKNEKWPRISRQPGQTKNKTTRHGDRFKAADNLLLIGARESGFFSSSPAQFVLIYSMTICNETSKSSSSSSSLSSSLSSLSSRHHHHHYHHLSVHSSDDHLVDMCKTFISFYLNK